VNAVRAVGELIDMYGDDAFRKLFLDNHIPPGPPVTRLAHAKKYVINEFITMQVMMASGFKHFGGKNYAGYLKGSRYNGIPQVREYRPITGMGAAENNHPHAGGRPLHTGKGQAILVGLRHARQNAV
jgi:hypothetical protein